MTEKLAQRNYYGKALAKLEDFKKYCKCFPSFASLNLGSIGCISSHLLTIFDDRLAIVDAAVLLRQRAINHFEQLSV